MNMPIHYIGLDVHADSISIAIAEAGRGGEVRFYGKIPNDLHMVDKAFKKLGHPERELKVCYEAGPCGFVLARHFARKKIECLVVAPSLIPKGASDRIKTDRRDALALARLHRAGELTAVRVPDARDEAVRDLCRARTDAVRDLRACRFQLKAFLLRNGYRYQEGTAWTEKHLAYIRGLTLPHPAMRAAMEEYLMAITAAGERIERIEVAMEAQLGEWHMEPVARALMAMRGFSIIAAMITVSELGDIHRFEHPRQLMAYIGLVGREDSSGDKEKRGSITKAGNSHLRWILCESSQHYRLPPGVSERLSKRQSAVDKRIRKTVAAIAWKAQIRLHERGSKLASRRLTRQKIQVALARELCGFVWAVMRAATPALTPAKQTKATAAEI
jgi:transposase